MMYNFYQVAGLMFSVAGLATVIYGGVIYIIMRDYEKKGDKK